MPHAFLYIHQHALCSYSGSGQNLYNGNKQCTRKVFCIVYNAWIPIIDLR